MNSSKNIINVGTVFALHDHSKTSRSFALNKQTTISTNGKIRQLISVPKQVIESVLYSKPVSDIKNISARTVNKLATNGYNNSLHLLGGLRPLQASSPVADAVIVLTTFNYVMGCTAALSTPDNKNPMMAYEAGTDSYANSTETLTTSASRNPCRRHYFDCGEYSEDGNRCVHPRKVCNARIDCDNGSDESNCCKPDEFDCGVGDSPKCIPKSWVCDEGNDCHNGSDESNCCKPDEFDCGVDISKDEHRCIPELWACNNKVDCHNGSDERNCCKSDEFDCGIYNITKDAHRCIPELLVCNNNFDCHDESDEKDCVLPTCRTDEFDCGVGGSKEGGQCIPEGWKCDNEIDCRDESDERDCVLPTCSTDEFDCWVGGSKDGYQCIPEDWRCDNDNDCDDNSDERDCILTTCNPDQFKCWEMPTQGTGCIPDRWVCDGDNDCEDGSDEKDCMTTCRPDEFDCMVGQSKYGHRCIPDRWVCNDKGDCPDKSDELNCNITANPIVNPCNPDNEFHCALDSESADFNKYTVCIDIDSRCDGMEDCPDGLDEKNCTEVLATALGSTETVTAIPGSTEITSSLQPLWDSLTDYTTYLPWWSDDQVKEKEENKQKGQKGISPLAIGLGIGGVGLTAALGSVVIWNAVKRREEGLTDGKIIAWKHALWGGVKDLVHFKLRRTQQGPPPRSPIYIGKDDLEMNLVNPLYDGTPKKEQTPDTTKFSETSENLGNASVKNRLLSEVEKTTASSQKENYKYEKLIDYELSIGFQK